MSAIGAPAIALALLASYDPAIDDAIRPRRAWAVSAGVQRLQDDFGVAGQVVFPRLLDDRLAVRVEGGVGWFPDVRPLPADAEDEDFGTWSLYGHARVLLEAGLRLAVPVGRLYVAAGPSVVFTASELSSTRVGFGAYGAIGAELFAGDGFRTYPVSLYAELGASAHAARADMPRRVGSSQTDPGSAARSIATGFAMFGGVRIYLDDD